jgi:hypothetical protein
LIAGAVIAAAVVTTTPSVALAEGATCVGQSCEGTYLAVTTTGDANSSSGVAVSGTGTARGGIAEASAIGSYATVADPTTGEETGLNNTGDAAVPATVEQVALATVSPPPEVIAAKEQIVARLGPEIEYQLAALQYGLDPTLADRACPDGRCPSRYRTLSQPLTYQQNYNWCGPASTSLVLQQITGTAWDQRTIARTFGIERSGGTYYKAIVTKLNQSQGAVKFIASTLKENKPSDYMTKLVAAVDYWDGYQNHSIINNINTAPLHYWGDSSKGTDHYNISHGYDLQGGGFVNIAEEYDPARVGVKRRTNPYGYHRVPLQQIYTADRANTYNHGIVIW